MFSRKGNLRLFLKSSKMLAVHNCTHFFSSISIASGRVTLPPSGLDATEATNKENAENNSNAIAGLRPPFERCAGRSLISKRKLEDLMDAMHTATTATAAAALRQDKRSKCGSASASASPLNFSERAPSVTAKVNNPQGPVCSWQNDPHSNCSLIADNGEADDVVDRCEFYLPSPVASQHSHSSAFDLVSCRYSVL